MNNMKKKFLEALSTLLYSWGGDTPPEAIWAANGFLDMWRHAGYKIPDEFVEDNQNDENGKLFEWLEKNL